MLKQMPDMPAGTLGFEAIGEVDDDDFEDTVEPVLRREIAAGRAIRMLYLLGPELREYEGDALADEVKFAARHAGSYDCRGGQRSGLAAAGAARAVGTRAGTAASVPARRAAASQGVGGRGAGATTVTLTERARDCAGVDPVG
jgi:hypothetical protein